jgi:hypothetical protein
MEERYAPTEAIHIEAAIKVINYECMKIVKRAIEIHSLFMEGACDHGVRPGELLCLRCFPPEAQPEAASEEAKRTVAREEAKPGSSEAPVITPSGGMYHDMRYILSRQSRKDAIDAVKSQPAAGRSVGEVGHICKKSETGLHECKRCGAVFLAGHDTLPVGLTDEQLGAIKARVAKFKPTTTLINGAPESLVSDLEFALAELERLRGIK